MCLWRPNWIWVYLHKNVCISFAVTCYLPYTVRIAQEGRETSSVFQLGCDRVTDIRYLSEFSCTQMLNLLTDFLRKTNVLIVFIFCTNWELFNISGSTMSHFYSEINALFFHTSLHSRDFGENRHAWYLFIMVRACFQQRQRPTQTYTWHGSVDLSNLNFKLKLWFVTTAPPHSQDFHNFLFICIPSLLASVG